MNFAKMYASIVLGFELLLSRTDGDKLCSCYSFNNKSFGWTWPQAMGSCQNRKKTLVMMETEREWEFIKNEIQNRVGSKNGEWFIGLERNITTGNWTWINGKPLTIDKWQGSNPDPNDFYGMIHEKFGFYGSFSTVKVEVQRGWICEEETGIDHPQAKSG
ncbi:C-type lectin domain family 4 member E-like [Stylophora pistillata]|uniref:C-type lectin domain family 4 member E-like n=1 Tax=Stylophora pistillata TaxID=50429 RepID=UPI000C0501EC|nr:C-type lectin domain family 4 member E-like [Stylophora pistillata]